MAGFPQKTERFLVRQVDKITQEAKATFEQVTEGWTSKPQFTASTQLEGTTIKSEVTTDSPIFNFVDQGVRPHAIVGSPTLRYQRGYSPRTTPGRLRGVDFVRGIVRGQVEFARSVQHPGIAARHFTAQVREDAIRQAQHTLGPSFRGIL